LNDGIDAVAAKGGVPRRAADLKQVLGDIPDEPQMSAFSFPGEQADAAAPSAGGAPASAASAQKSLPKPPRKGLPAPPPGPGSAPKPTAASNGQALDPATLGAAPEQSEPTDPEEAEWRGVFDDFVRTKQECGENTDGFTYEKFRQTLTKNRDALISRHGARSVKFSVYVKEGKAALKASPLKT
jgi:hypothetical protein